MNTSSNILVIRRSSLGDVLLLGPVLRGLRKRFPGHRIIWVTQSQFGSIWQTSGLVDQIVEWNKSDSPPIDELSRIEYEYVLDLQASPRSRKLARSLHATHRSEAPPPRLSRFLHIYFRAGTLASNPPVPMRYLNAATEWGVAYDGCGLGLATSRQEIATLGYDIEKARIAIAPGSKHRTKCWQLERYLELASRIDRNGMGLLWICGPDETAIRTKIASQRFTDSILTDSSWSIVKTISAISLCRAAVTNDSAAMHMAAGTDRPGLAFFGPTVKEFGFAPFESQMEVIERNLWCRPCSPHGSSRCPLGHHRCMNDISVNEVWDRLKSISEAKA